MLAITSKSSLLNRRRFGWIIIHRTAFYACRSAYDTEITLFCEQTERCMRTTCGHYYWTLSTRDPTLQEIADAFDEAHRNEN
jgi:hypothetical protein